MAKKKSNADPESGSTKSKNTGKLTTPERSITSILGLMLFFFGLFSGVSFLSFFFSWQADQSAFHQSFFSLLFDDSFRVKNLLGKIGAALGQLFVYRWFGLGALLLSYFWMLLGLRIFLKIHWKVSTKTFAWVLFFVIWIAATTGFFGGATHTVVSGGLGFFFSNWLVALTGKVGALLVLMAALVIFLTAHFRWNATDYQHFFNLLTNKSQQVKDAVQKKAPAEIPVPEVVNAPPRELDKKDRLEVFFGTSNERESDIPNDVEVDSLVSIHPSFEKTAESDDFSFEIAKEAQAPTPSEPLVVQPIQEEVLDESDFTPDAGQGPYDHTLELSRYQMPSLDLLDEHGSGSIQINQQELEDNKNKIVETLNNYKIDIQKIKATIGPTVTLYEIIPAAGVRISKIRSLEDDIALSLSALGIRIIAPIPGKGTIGIEVPNTTPAVVSMRTVLASEKFRNSKMDLPIALGKTIANETLVADLAKMPHLLMAGATGQGKSVGLNCILTSLLYKKHPSEIKFVLVDPKKVELTLFNKIERHYLAKLPDTEDAIITDTTKVIHTLNSLCIEMDNRYELLKNAMVRNLKEYNAKFTARRLNPNEGHRYLPYIVLVIDEFADLIMTAGKEVEMPIARLAQLARAIGIHLIVATQRPSVNVITGIIKANFPARIAFRVSSKIDSRTILDTGGADQLIGKGDMLYSTGNELIRIQCAFVDTPEVDKICDFIGAQQAYPTAYLLPEYVGEDSGGIEELDPADRDAMFEDAARIVVINQQGSASLLQRKLKLGYNRAGRIIDQLEAAGIIGPFEGSKARQVLIQDEHSLEQILRGGR